jgi:signal peptidase I
VVLLVAAGCADSRGGHVYRVPSSSMEPTLHCARPAPGCEANERDLVYAVPYKDSEPQRGDIVVLQTPSLARTECGASGLFIKRVIGLPGEAWRERAGADYIDGKRLDEPYLRPGRRDNRTLSLADVPPGGKFTRIPPRMYLVLGDNRRSSCDSRVWGLVPLANIRGRVIEIKRGSKRIHLR